MDIRIETQNVVLPANSLDTLRQRVGRVMGRVSDKVSCIHLSLRDVNAAKGGCDKLCTIRISLLHGGEILVNDRSSKLSKALFRGLRRSRVLLRREMRRRRQRGRGRNRLAFA